MKILVMMGVTLITTKTEAPHVALHKRYDGLGKKLELLLNGCVGRGEAVDTQVSSISSAVRHVFLGRFSFVVSLGIVFASLSYMSW